MIETERLLLRPWEDKDAEDLYRYASSPLVGPAAGWPVHTSVENSLEIIHGVLSAPETYAVVLKSTNRPVGSVGLMVGAANNIGLPNTQGELGYWIGVPYWGQGLIPEASRALLRRGFEELGLEAIWCGFVSQYTRENVPCAMLNETRTEHISVLTRADWARQQKETEYRG